MQRTSMNRGAIVIGLMLMNVMVITLIRPVNPVGIIVMNTTAIIVFLGALRLLKR